MALKRKITGGVLVFIGYLLSPLSWWNDMFVNVPLAMLFAWVVSAFYRPSFTVALIVGYWLTNVLGFVLMHKGAQAVLDRGERKSRRRELFVDILISLFYTLIIVLLVQAGVLKPISGYLRR